MEQGLGEHRRLVQHRGHGFEAGLLAVRHCQHHALYPAVSLGKGNQDPHARRNGELRRNPIGIGLVNGIYRRRDGNLGNQETLLRRSAQILFLGHGGQLALSQLPGWPA